MSSTGYIAVGKQSLTGGPGFMLESGSVYVHNDMPDYSKRMYDDSLTEPAPVPVTADEEKAIYEGLADLACGRVTEVPLGADILDSLDA